MRILCTKMLYRKIVVNSLWLKTQGSCRYHNQQSTKKDTWYLICSFIWWIHTGMFLLVHRACNTLHWLLTDLNLLYSKLILHIENGFRRMIIFIKTLFLLHYSVISKCFILFIYTSLLLSKLCCDLFAEPITHHLTSMSIENEKVADVWKEANTFPIPKGGHVSKKNLRPILLLLISKILERYVLKSVKKL